MISIVTESLNRDNHDELIKHIVQGQIKAYSGEAKYTYSEGYFSPFEKKVADSTIGMLTSTGHFVEGDDPNPLNVEGMTQEEAIDRVNDFLREKPVLSSIPKLVDKEDLRVRHGGYDISGALADPNVAFPLDIVKDLEANGDIGKLTDNLYSFIGACAQKPLISEVENNWLQMIKAEELDGIILVPA